ncbi:MAG: twin-arginine translocation signal domain-containing protein [Nanoarchaeota archaeon]
MLNVIKEDLEGITKWAPNEINRRDFLKLAGTAAGAIAYQLFRPRKSDACIGSRTETTFYEKFVQPAISNPELLQSDPDGKVYLRMNAEREVIMQTMNNPNAKNPRRVTAGNEPLPGKEPLYETLQVALQAEPNSPNTHLIEFDRDGRVSAIYDYKGDILPFKVIRYRGGCGPSYKLG